MGCWSTASGRSNGTIRETDGRRFVRKPTRFRNWITRGRQPGPDRRGRLPGRARPLSPLCFARLPVGASHADLPQAQAARGRRSRSRSSRRSMGERRLDLRRGPGGVDRDPLNGAASSAEIYLRPSRDYTGRVTVPVLWDKERGHDRQQRVVGDHPHAQRGFDAVRRRAAPTSTRTSCAARSTRQRARLRRRSTTASIAPASRPRRRPTRRPSATLFDALDALEAAPRDAALSRRRAR